VLLPLDGLVRRWRRPRSRALEIGALRERLAAAAREDGDAEAIALARELRELKPQVLRAFGGATACTGCARGRSEPHGHWSGGFCCGGRTDGVFDDEEVAALALGGTRPGDLQGPAGDHAGCAFRGPGGCSLEPRDRPALCVRFACRELETELRGRGEWPAVRAMTRRLEETFRRFVAARSRSTGSSGLADEPARPLAR
jgi:hypothetical protein